MWLDGICECGWPVIETDGDDTYDYKNMCLNPKCQHHCWHFCFDTSELEYYKHNSKLGEVIVELLKQNDNL